MSAATTPTPASHAVPAFVRWATRVRGERAGEPVNFSLTVATMEGSKNLITACDYDNGSCGALALALRDSIDEFARKQGAAYAPQYQAFFACASDVKGVIFAQFPWPMPPLAEDWRAENLSSSEIWALRETLNLAFASPSIHDTDSYRKEHIGYLIEKCAKNSVPVARVARLLDILDLDDDWTVERMKTYRGVEAAEREDEARDMLRAASTIAYDNNLAAVLALTALTKEKGR